MIPEFPNFKKIELSDQSLIEKNTKRFLPYSDSNFVSLWSWDRGQTRVATLYGNLIFMLQDYISKEKFLTFTGRNKVEDTVKQLIHFAEENKLNTTLKLIPEPAIRSLGADHEIKVAEDQDNFDYIFSTENIASLIGRKYHTKKRFVNYFMRANQTKIVSLNLVEKKIQRKVLKTFRLWVRSRKKMLIFSLNEYYAICRLLKNAECFKLEAVGVIVDGKLVAFSIHEIAGKGYAIGHFEKADIRLPGIFQYMKMHVAQHLLSKGIKYINDEQDLGIPGLRKAKLSYRPIKFLKKYTVSLKE